MLIKPMELLIQLSFVVLLLLVIVQDFKYRAISWLLIPALLLITVVRGVEMTSIETLLAFSLINIAFIAIQLLLLSLYISVKNRRLINIVDSHIGLGDVLFFLVLCTAFSTLNFVLFYVSALLFSLLGFVIYQSFSKKEESSVPLAGLFSIAMLFVLLVHVVRPDLNFYNDIVFLR